MPHPTAEKLRAEIESTQRVAYIDLLRRLASAAADALDAYHDALDGLEVEPCNVCAGSGAHEFYEDSDYGHAGLVKRDCYFCLGTGKRLRRRAIPGAPGAV